MLWDTNLTPEQNEANGAKYSFSTVRDAKKSWALLMGRRGSHFEVRLNPILERCGLDPSVDAELADNDYMLLWLGMFGLLPLSFPWLRIGEYCEGICKHGRGQQGMLSPYHVH